MKIFLFLFCILLSSLFSQSVKEVDAMLSFNHKANDLLLRFKEGTSAEIKEMIFQKLGAISVKEYELVTDLYLVTLPARSDLKSALIWAMDNEEVMYSEPNYVRNLFKEPNDTLYQDIWGLKKIKAPAAWDVSTQSSFIVGVIDSGITYNHEDLAANMWINTAEQNGTADNDDDGNGYEDDIYGYDFANGDGDPMDEPDGSEIQYHGTHVAGIIGALGNNNLGVVGVCWNVKLMALKSYQNGTGSVAHSIEALQYGIKKGAKIFNMSYGQNVFSKSESDAIEHANRKGVLCIAAAGNDSANNDVNPMYPASYSLPNLISVAASNENDQLADFSNFGANSVHLMAPGVGIFSTIGGGYEAKNGTSMAAPYVTGCSALLFHRFPELTPEQIRGKILRNVTKLPGGRQNTISNGQINIQQAINDVQEVKKNYGGGGGSGCTSSHCPNSTSWDFIPYLFLLLLFAWKRK